MTHPDPGARDHAPPGTDRLLAGLTPEQAQAVTHGTGPLLILAGPGAGKTRTLTHRAAYLLASGRAQPWEILAVTFSVRAAGELRLRLADLFGETVARGVTAATFHSVCARLLREHATVEHPAAPLIAAVWRESDIELRRSNSFEFDDLLACAVRLLSEHPHRLTWLRERWRWLLADEFQDTSHAQATLVDLLAGPDGNLCVCGDDDQLIHGWRHADPRQLLCFDDRHPTHARIVLGRNFRSRAEILDAAARCVSHNERRAPKALIAMRGPGGHVRVRAFANEYHEANWVAAGSADALAAGIPPTEILALARTGYATEPLQRALAHAGIAHRVLGSLGLYERAEVRDALAYLTLIQNPADAQALRRAVGSPRRGIGAATVSRLVAWARERHRGDLIVASAHADHLEAVRTQAARARLIEFGTALEHVRSELDSGRSIGHVAIATVTMPGGLVRHYQHQRDHTPDPERRRDAERVLEDLRSLCRAAQAYEKQHERATLTGFLELAAGLHAQEVDVANDRRPRRRSGCGAGT
jgi:DNA helicase II / ATP-dependent DNA helicase PcrA